MGDMEEVSLLALSFVRMNVRLKQVSDLREMLPQGTAFHKRL